MTPIRATDKDGIAGIIKTGKPAGLWMAQSTAFPKIWTGAVSDGKKAVRHHGTFGDVLAWLQKKDGILRDARADRVIRDSSDVFSGLRVTLGAVERIPEADMPRAERYTGFTCRIDRGKRGLKTPTNDGTGRAVRNKEKLTERDEKIKELVLQGLTGKRVAEELGMSKKAAEARITAIRKAGELPPYDPKTANRDSAHFWTPEEDARIMALFAEGKNSVQIGDTLCKELNRTKEAIAVRARRMRKEIS